MEKRRKIIMGTLVTFTMGLFVTAIAVPVAMTKNNDKPIVTPADDVASVTSAIKAAIKTGWTTTESETVTSSKINDDMPESIVSETTLTSDVLTTDMGITLAGVWPSDLRGTEVKYTYTKEYYDFVTGNVMTITVSKGTATASTFTVNIQDVDQKQNDDITSVVLGIKAAIKTGWTTAESETVTSPKTNANMPANNLGYTAEFTPDVITTDMGVTLEGAWPTDLKGTDIKYAFRKESTSNTAGNALLIRVLKGDNYSGFTLYIQDTDQIASAAIVADVRSVELAIKAAIKTGWTTSTIETVTSSKPNSQIQLSFSTPRPLTPDVLTTDMGITLEGAWPTDLKGTEIKCSFTYAVATSVTGHRFEVMVSKAGAPTSTFAFYIKDTDHIVNYPIYALAFEIKAAIKTGWMYTWSETVTSSKTNANMPESVATATTLTSDVLTTDMGITLAGTWPMDLKGTEVKYTFTKESTTVTTGNVMIITISKTGALTATITLKIKDVDQAA